MAPDNARAACGWKGSKAWRLLRTMRWIQRERFSESGAPGADSAKSLIEKLKICKKSKLFLIFTMCVW